MGHAIDTALITKYGVSRPTIHSWLRKFGCIKARVPVISPILYERIKDEYINAKIGIEPLAIKYNVQKSTLGMMLKEDRVTRTVREAVTIANKTYRRKNPGPLNGRWRGGKWTEVTKDGRRGYVHIYCPEHPGAINRYVSEHRLVIERRLGRILRKEECVHHINGMRTDNRPENLMLFENNAAHNRYERARLSYLEQSIQRGDLVWVKGGPGGGNW